MEKTEKRVLKRPPELIRLCKVIEQIDAAWGELEEVRYQHLVRSRRPAPEIVQACRRLSEARDDVHEVAKRIAGEDDLDPESVLFWAAAREMGMSPPLEGATA
jgi:hypothetical protein